MRHYGVGQRLSPRYRPVDYGTRWRRQRLNEAKITHATPSDRRRVWHLSHDHAVISVINQRRTASLAIL